MFSSHEGGVGLQPSSLRLFPPALICACNMEKTNLAYASAFPPSIPALHVPPASTRTSSRSPSSDSPPPPALVEQIYIPHQQQLWLSLQICWHLGLRWVEHIEINFWLSLMVMSHYSSCIIWPYSSFRWETFFPLCIFFFFFTSRNKWSYTLEWVLPS